MQEYKTNFYAKPDVITSLELNNLFIRFLPRISI